MQLAPQRHQTLTAAPITLPSLSPFQVAIRDHRVTTARINDLDARGEGEESEARLVALDEEERAWIALLAAPCADRADAAALLHYASRVFTPGPAASLTDKLFEALAVALREPEAAGGGGDGASPGDDGPERVPVLAS